MYLLVTTYLLSSDSFMICRFVYEESLRATCYELITGIDMKKAFSFAAVGVTVFV